MSDSNGERLSWRGYSEKKPISLSDWIEDFSAPAPFIEKIPYCLESYQALTDMDGGERAALQERLFGATDNSVLASVYMGVIEHAEADWLQGQLKYCLYTMVRLMQLTAVDDIHSLEFEMLFASLPPAKATLLRKILSSSLYFYANGSMRKPFANVLKQPLYLELGIDILSSGLNLMLAEFQVRYSTPYPHLLEDLSKAYADTFPEMFKKYGLEQETFSTRRKHLLEDCLNRFALMDPEEPARVLIDAWAYLENAGANLKATADEFGMEYVLFDDLSRSKNLYERAYRNRRLAIFNFAPLNLLDPAGELFDRVNAERFENYDELGWVGLLNRYLNGEVFLANPPMTDILNDKAIYGLIPDLCKVFFAKSIELPLGEIRPCWSEEDFRKPDDPVLSWAKSNKDKAVIAHRYLEGGLGIRVGPATSTDEWESFIETFVADRPYLYVIRDYFAMDPDFSLRSLAAMSLGELCADMSEADLEFSDTLYGRLSTQSPVTSENHRAFLIFEASPSASAPPPRYHSQQRNTRS